MRRLYIVRYWVPFPSSEYGGVSIVIADTDKEVYDLLVAEYGDVYNDYFKKYDEFLIDEITKATRIEVNPDQSKGVIYAFHT